MKIIIMLILPTLLLANTSVERGLFSDMDVLEKYQVATDLRVESFTQDLQSKSLSTNYYHQQTLSLGVSANPFASSDRFKNTKVGLNLRSFSLGENSNEDRSLTMRPESNIFIGHKITLNNEFSITPQYVRGDLSRVSYYQENLTIWSETRNSLQVDFTYQNQSIALKPMVSLEVGQTFLRDNSLSETQKPITLAQLRGGVDLTPNTQATVGIQREQYDQWGLSHTESISIGMVHQLQ